MKPETIILGSLALVGVYLLIPKNEQGNLSSSGGLGSELGGLSGSSTTGGADDTGIHLDTPIPVLPGEQKKEKKEIDVESIWKQAISRGYTYDPGTDMLTKQLSENVKGTYSKSSTGFLVSWGAKDTKIKTSTSPTPNIKKVQSGGGYDSVSYGSETIPSWVSSTIRNAITEQGSIRYKKP